MGGTSTIQNPAEKQHAFCNMLQENNCWRESWLLEEQAQHRILLKNNIYIVTSYKRTNAKEDLDYGCNKHNIEFWWENKMHIITIVTCYERTNAKENHDYRRNKYNTKFWWENNMHIVTIVTCYEKTYAKENLNYGRSKHNTESCWGTTCIL